MPGRQIDTESKKLLVKLGGLDMMSGFYLGGSSGVAFHLGHRSITELDFATEAGELDPDVIEAGLIEIGSVAIQSQSRGSLSVNVDGVPVRFVSHPFPLLGPVTRFSKLRIGSPLDASLDTLAAISARGAKRDFVDFYFIIKSGYMVRNLVRRAAEKYHTLSYSVYQLLRGLVWFGDADGDIPPQTKNSWKWEDVKAFFQKEVKRLMIEYFEVP